MVKPMLLGKSHTFIGNPSRPIDNESDVLIAFHHSLFRHCSTPATWTQYNPSDITPIRNALNYWRPNINCKRNWIPSTRRSSSSWIRFGFLVPIGWRRLAFVSCCTVWLLLCTDFTWARYPSSRDQSLQLQLCGMRYTMMSSREVDIHSKSENFTRNMVCSKHLQYK